MKAKLFSSTLTFLIFLISCTKHEDSPIVYQSTLSAFDASWFTGAGSGYNCGFSQGKYEISVTNSSSFAYASVPTGEINYAYSATVNTIITLSDPSKIGYCGFLFNFTNLQNFSAFLIASNGYYTVVQYVNGVGTEIFPFSPTSAINTGSGIVNKIEIVQNIKTVKILINNVIINTFPVALYQNSRITLYAGSDNIHFTDTVVAFSNILVEKI